MKIFSGSTNKPLAEKIAKLLSLDLSPLEIHIFPDGEKRVRVLDKVLDEEVVIVQPTSPPVDQNYMELFFITDAMRRSGAKSVTLIVPYLGYQRQDHVFRSGEAVSLDVVVKTLEAVGADKIFFFDLHSVKTQELFSIPILHLSALPLFAEEIKKNYFKDRDCVLVSPDMGGVRRTRLLSEMLSNMPYATIVKNRDLVTGEVSAEEIEGEVGKKAIIIDDMISSGGTIVAATNLLVKNGVEEVVVFASHAVFSDDTPQILQNSQVLKIFVTDTIDVPKEKRFPKLEILSVAGMVASAIFKK